MNRRELGRWGEEMAAIFLRDKGYFLIESNVQTKHGEIDLVMRDEQTLVFVEVKTRRQTVFGTPAEAVTWKKQQKLRELGLAYLYKQGGKYPHFRFDVCEVVCKPDQQVEVRHIQHAF